MNKTFRRPDIDGLRAIAILSVLVFHFSPTWLPGGFTGVDIFFVISAYLITGQLYSNLVADTFSFKEFYLRRIKRIFPASILVFVVTTIIASQLNSSLLSSAKYIPVFLFNQHASDYFTQDTQKNFFLHYWSLSIEEQFYFIWPLLLGVVFWSSRKFLSPGQRSVALPIISFLIGAVCFSLAEKWSHIPELAGTVYFFSIPRFGEMAIGAIAALLPAVSLKDRSLVNGITIIGTLGLVFSMYGLNETSYPGIHALIPCVSTVLLLYFRKTADGKPTLMARILASRPLTFVGLISFSLYLWHWPVLAVSRFMLGTNDLSAFWMVIDLCLISLLSVFTYYLVERPFIQSSVSFNWAAPSCAVLSIACVTLIVSLTGLEELNLKPLIGGKYSNVTVDGQNIHLTEGWIAPCWEKSHKDLSKRSIDQTCAIGAAQPPSILMVGDSHGAALGGFIDTLGKNEEFSVTSYQVGACQIAEWGIAARAPTIVRTEERTKKCKDLLTYIQTNYRTYKAIFVVNAFNLFAGDFNVFSKKYEEPSPTKLDVLRSIAKTTPVYFFYDSPVIDRSIQYSPFLAKLGFKPRGFIVAGGNRGNLIMKKIVESIPGVHWVDLSRAYQELTQDNFIYHGLPVYVDTNHLNGYGAISLANIFIRQGDCTICQKTVDLFPETHGMIAFGSNRHIQPRTSLSN